MNGRPGRTKVRTADGWLEFPDYFRPARALNDEVHEVRFDGIDSAQPTPEVTDAIERADIIVVAPSNRRQRRAHLALAGVIEARSGATARRIAVSPIVGGAARASRGTDDAVARVDGQRLPESGYYAQRYRAARRARDRDADASDAEQIRSLGIEPASPRTVVADRAAGRARAPRDSVVRDLALARGCRRGYQRAPTGCAIWRI